MNPPSLRNSRGIAGGRPAGLAVLVGCTTLFLAGVVGAGEIRTLATVHELFSPPESTHSEISPSGRFTATLFFDAERDRPGVRLRHVDSDDEREIFGPKSLGRKHWIENLLWDGPDSLIIEYARSRSEQENVHEIVVLEPGAGKVAFERRMLKAWGTIVDSSPTRPGEVLFVHGQSPGSVHRASLALLERPHHSWKDLDPDSSEAPTLLARIDESVFAWLVDHEGGVRAAMSFSEDPLELRLWYRAKADGRWEIVRREDEVDRFEDLVPLGFSADGQRLLVASALERDRYGLYEYDPATNQVGKLVYEHPTAELDGLVLDADRREVLAAVYIEDGERRYAYLSSGSEEIRAATARHFPGSIVSITSLSADRRRMTLFVSSANDPGGFVAYDLADDEVEPLGRVAPWLDDDLLAGMEVLDIPNPDGPALEAFLTLPPIPGSKPPLVVMPHGGPIGMADVRGYSSDVQYLARSGFAVLQVNYRGSGGYGRRFQEAGHRQWGRGIEDDIETAVDHVLASGRVDGGRMCVVGASYGGYSALMMVIREPKRYRCAASLSGVTDIALLFNVDSVTGGEILTSQMEKIVGDPDRDYEEMRRYSPVYRADEIEVPIHLAHGEWDRTVDLDHLIRMKLALDLAKTPAQATIYAKMGHGFASREAAVRHWLNLYAFLAQHLNR
jgi:dipeptidyl aminopeptidase/acylaminoacyl peptidase